MTQRLLFVQDHATGIYSVRELCECYGISEKTGYKWLARYTAEGEPGLLDRSHAPRSVRHRLAEDIAAAIIALRGEHPRWGARKLLAVLERRHPHLSWPAASTAAALLKRRGLILPRRRRKKLGHPGPPQTVIERANQVWTADFKGQFRLGDRHYCFPLTVADAYSRFLLGCRGLKSTATRGARPVFAQLFREYGLPEAIRTDNGVPFAQASFHRLSRLSVWWIHLGIRPELIEPARPDQNGSHERMHRELKAETARPAASSQRAQQKRFDQFRSMYNTERPHQALGQRTPASQYSPSSRTFPERLPRLEYPGHYEVRRVGSNACFRWRGKYLCISHVLEGEDLGFTPVTDAIWEIYLGAVPIGRLNETTMQVTPTFNRVSPIVPD